MQKVGSRPFLVTLSLFIALSLINPTKASAAEGISELTFDSSSYSIGDEISLEFSVEAPSNPKYNYKVGVSFNGIVNNFSFSGTSDLIEGTLSSGKWRMLVKIPADTIGDRYSVYFKPLGKQGPFPKNLKLAANYSAIVNIFGKSPPTYPEIQVSNSKIDKSNYVPGDSVSISFETAILSGQVNEDTERPIISLKDVRTGNLIYPIINNKRSKPLVIGSYQTGIWTSKFQLMSNMLSTEISIVLTIPGKSNLSSVKTDLGIITINSPIPEVQVLSIKYDKKIYKTTDKLEVFFQTLSSGFASSDSVKPYLIFTDIDRTDLSEKIIPELLSGTINDGQWRATVSVPTTIKPGDYFLGFYNESGTIRGLGPVIKVGTEIRCIKGKLSKKILVTNPKCPSGYKKA
jgi:hypothetical protein